MRFIALPKRLVTAIHSGMQSHRVRLFFAASNDKMRLMSRYHLEPPVSIEARQAGRGKSLNTTVSFWILALCLHLYLIAPAPAQDRDNCLYCHQFPGLSRLDAETGQVRLFYVDPNYMHAARGPHARLACTDCHDADAVRVVPHRTVAPVDCARQCHLAGADGAERRFSHQGAADHLARSVHAPETLEKVRLSTGPLLQPGQSLCLYCHDEPVFRTDWNQTHKDLGAQRCESCHSVGLPLETDYFLRHVVARQRPARATLEQAQICAVCHSDPKFLADHAADDPVASYLRSFHGKAALLRDSETPDCTACHSGRNEDVHAMLGPADPGSAVHVDRRAESCRSTACHPGADLAIAATAVHLDLPTASGSAEYLLAVAFIILTIVSFGPSALIVILELAQIVLGRHDRTHGPLRQLTAAVLTHPQGRARLTRFTVGQRMQHWVLTLLFVLLCLTGFPMKFPEQAWADWLIDRFSGLSEARLVHHWAGVALVAGFMLHLIAVIPGFIARARELGGRSWRGFWLAYTRLPLAVTPADLRKAGQLFAFLLGLRRERPLFGRFSASEKFEYLGVMWGTTLLGVTGFMLWGEQITSHLFGGRVFNLATIIHTYEAFLAVIHVGILHMYSVLLAPAVFPLSPATLNGLTPADKLAHENGEFVLEVARDLGLGPTSGPLAEETILA